MRTSAPHSLRHVEPVCAELVQQTQGAFFWDYSGYSYSGLGIPEYTEFQFRKERFF